MLLKPPSSRRILESASKGPEYVRYRLLCDCTIRRVRIKSKGESKMPVRRCEATGRNMGGWWKGESEGKNVD